MDRPHGERGKRIIAPMLLAFLLFLIAAGIVYASSPTLLALQGKLTNSTTGATIVAADITVNVSDTRGRTVWNQTYVNGVSNGFFDLLLGSDASNPLNLTYNMDYNISISAGDSTTQIGGTYRFRSGVGLISPSNLSSGNFSALGNFSFGSTAYIDQTNEKIGIGTTNPITELHILDDDGSNMDIKLGWYGGTQRLRFDGTDSDPVINRPSNRILYLGETSDSAGFGFRGSGDSYFEGSLGIGTTSPRYGLDVAGDALFNATLNRQFFFDSGSGRLGIGTSSPAATLELRDNTHGNSNLDGKIVLGSSADGGRAEIDYSWSGDTLLNITNTYDTGGGPIAFKTGNTEAMRLISGNVGIGTTNPSAKLTVNGDVNISGARTLYLGNAGSAPGTFGWFQSGSDVGVNLGVNTGNNNPDYAQVWNGYVVTPASSIWTVRARSAGDSGTAGTALWLNASSRQMSIGNTYSSASLQVEDFISDTLVNISADDASPLQLVLDQKSTGQAWAITTAETNQLLFRDITDSRDVFSLDGEGNVGIGNTIPNNTLDVSGDANITGTTFVNTLSFRDGSSQTSAALSATDNATSALWNASGSDIFLRDQSGTVGIGVASPDARLYIGGTAFTVDDTLLTLSPRSDTTDRQWDFIVGGTSGSYTQYGNYPLLIQQDTGDTSPSDLVLVPERNTIFASGKVGIGAASPGMSLDVEGNASISGNLSVEGNLSAGGTDLFVDTTSGRVGIGTKPLAGTLLHVSGGQLFTNYDHGTTAALDVLNQGGGPAAILRGKVGVNTTDPLGTFHVVNANTDFIVTAGGNVGIGTSDPKAPLHIAMAPPTDNGFDGQVRIDHTNAKLLLNSTGASNEASVIFDGGGARVGWRIGLDTGFDSHFSIRDEAATYLSIENGTGNVGIGTTAPQSIVHISGNTPNFMLESSSTESQIVLNTSGDDWNIQADDATGLLEFSATQASGGIGQVLLLEHGTGNVGIGTTGPTANLHVHESSPSANQIVLNVSTNGGSRFLVDEDGDAFIRGQTLEVGNSAGGHIDIVDDGGVPRYALARSTATTDGLIIGDGSNLGTTVGIGYGVTQAIPEMLSVEGGVFFNATGFPEGFIFDDSTGRIGIGTSNPSKSLEVYGGGIMLNGTGSGSNREIIIDGTTGGNNALFVLRTSFSRSINFQDSAGNAVWTIQVPGGENRLRFNDDDGNTLLNLDQTGVVGVGNNHPNATLDVSGTVNADTLSFNDGTSQTSAGLTLGDNTTSSLWNVSGTDIFLRHQSGKVGIGTKAVESEALHVSDGTDSGFSTALSGQGQLIVEGDAAYVTIAGSTDAGLYISDQGASSGDRVFYLLSRDGAFQLLAGTDDGSGTADHIGYYLEHTTGYVGINQSSPQGTFHVTNANTDFIVDEGGNVGVGSVSPSKRLDVSDGVDSITLDPSAAMPTINTTSPGGNAKNLTLASEDGSIIMQLG